MAVVDRFGFLLTEIEKTCSNARDILAIIGILYGCKRTLQCMKCLIKAANEHLLSKLSFIRDYKKRFGLWAVVTGSSEGIGLAYAKELARRGLNVILISRGESKLYKAAKDIEEQFEVETHAIAVDFAHGKDIYEKIWNEIKDKEIGILVNNVGVMYEFPQLFLDVPVEKLWSLVNVNVAAATMMTHMIMPQMVDRNKGAIIMVSSGSCTKITPQMTVYAATTCFLDYFARGLQYEYKDSGVIIQSLMPFYVATRMTRYSQTLSKPSLMIPSADDYARSAVATLGYTSRTSGYWPHTIQAWFSECVPEWLWMWGATRLNNALRRQGQEKLHKRKLRKTVSSELSCESDS